jgi:hypothetical protein
VRTPVPPVSTVPVKSNGNPIRLKFTPEIKRVFLAGIRQGYHIQHAAAIAGVSAETVRRHRKSDPTFHDEVMEAEGLFVLATMQKMDELGKDNLDHWRWKLEKRFPELYGKQTAYTQVNAQQNNILMAPLPSIDEIIEKITALRTKALAEHIEREERTITLSPDEYVDALIERRADGPLPD